MAPESARPQPAVASRAKARPGVERWRPLVATYDWPVDEVLAVMHCESRGDPGAVSPRGHVGLMQIEGGPLDPKQNLDWAYGMWRRWRWTRWSCKP